MNYYIKEGKLYQGTIYNMILQNDYITIHTWPARYVCVCVCARKVAPHKIWMGLKQANQQKLCS